MLNSLYLFAHQDDEFGVFHQIETDIAHGYRVVCAYLTTGVGHGRNPSYRNLESLGVLRSLGVLQSDIYFIGEKFGIADGCLIENLDTVGRWLEEWVQNSSIRSVYVMAWEGGHPDHDAIHAVAVQVLKDRGFLQLLRQFPLYNGWRLPWKFFSVLRPLPQNGPITRIRISRAARIRYLGYCLQYHSQFTSWIGLFPFVVARYIIFGYQELQACSSDRVISRPHEGRLYYEKRGFSIWPVVEQKLFLWRHAKTASKS